MLEGYRRSFECATGRVVSDSSRETSLPDRRAPHGAFVAVTGQSPVAGRATGVAAVHHRSWTSSPDQLAIPTGQALPVDCSCGVILLPNGRPLTVAASDGLAGSVDEIQYQAGQGPRPAASHTGQLHHVPDISREKRWPRFASHGFAQGARRIVRPAERIRAGTAGALNLYATQPEVTTRPRSSRPRFSPATWPVPWPSRRSWPIRSSCRRICGRRWPPGRSSTRRWASDGRRRRDAQAGVRDPAPGLEQSHSRWRPSRGHRGRGQRPPPGPDSFQP